MSQKKINSEEIKGLVRIIRFNIGNYLHGYEEYEIKKTEDGAEVKVEGTTYWNTLPKVYHIGNRRWQNLVNKLYDKIHVDEWKKNYKPEGMIVDGDYWCLEIVLTNRRRRSYHGDNTFPPNWKEFMAIFRGFRPKSKDALL